MVAKCLNFQWFISSYLASIIPCFPGCFLGREERNCLQSHGIESQISSLGKNKVWFRFGTKKVYKILQTMMLTAVYSSATAGNRVGLQNKSNSLRRTTMQKAIRLILMLFMIVASFAALSTPTPKAAAVYAEGSSPMPMCDPGVPCAIEAASAHK
jgi:hypothetical protein